MDRRMKDRGWVIPVIALGIGGFAGGCSSTDLASGARRGSALDTGSEPARATRVSSGPRMDSTLNRAELRARCVEVLGEAACDADPQVRANALEGLETSPDRLASAVGVGLRDENAGVRAVAAMMVGRGRIKALSSSVEPLTRDSSPFVKASAIYALHRLGQPTDLAPLASLLLTDPSPRVRAHAVFILGEIGDKSALAMIRQAARAVIPRASTDELRLMQLQIAEAMIKLGDESQIGVVRASLYPSRPEELEATALAAQIIGEIQDKGAIDELIYLSAYWNEQRQKLPAEVRLAAAGSLAKLGLTEGWFIADEYRKAEQATIRAQAAMVYGETDGPGNLAALEGLLGDPEAPVRVAAASGVLRYLERQGSIAGAGGE